LGTHPALLQREEKDTAVKKPSQSEKIRKRHSRSTNQNLFHNGFYLGFTDGGVTSVTGRNVHGSINGTGRKP
jgi:hypothetical protein